MDNQSDNVPGNTEARPFSAGDALREARERFGLSVADVANRLKFAPRQFEALEANDFARLPEMAFVRGFVRSYARLLELDPAPLLAALPQAPAQAAPMVETAAMEVPFPGGYAARKLNLVWMAGGGGVAILLGLFVWLHDGTSTISSEQQTTVQTVELPAVAELPISAVTANPSAVPDALPDAGSGQAAANQSALIHLAFDDDAWVEVTDKNGQVLLAQLNVRGSEQRLNGSPPFSMVIGNASGVRLYYQGKRVDLAPYNNAEVARLTLE